MQLPLDQIQGNITPGFRKDHQAFLFFRFRPDEKGVAGARAWIHELLPMIATAEEVATFNRLFRLVKKRQRGTESRVISSTWINVAFSAAGFRRLEPPGWNTFLPDFLRPPDVRAHNLGDGYVYEKFELGARPENEPDAMLVIGADTQADLIVEVMRQLYAARGLSLLIAPQVGQTLGDGREHFGFRDGISHPDPEDPLDGWDWTGQHNPVVAPGEFILGLPREGQTSEPGVGAFCGPSWARNGSYLVFRKLKQDVALFRKEVRKAFKAVQEADQYAQIRGAGITEEQMKARLMGRWPSGVKLTFDASATAPTDPGAGYEHLSDIPSWMVNIWRDEFKADEHGARCPLFAHIRKGHPRNSNNARSHRIIRRGIPYGPPFDEQAAKDDRDRGLLFVAYQANLRQQFRKIQADWLSSRNVADEDAPQNRAFRDWPGLDPIAGVRDPNSPQNVIFVPETGQHRNIAYPKPPLPQAVTVQASGYFFAPSVSALAMLASD